MTERSQIDIVDENKDFCLIVGKLIKCFRVNKGLKQKVLAEKVGITGALLSIYENGRERISVSLLDKVCKQLEIKLSDFFLELEKYLSIK